MHSEQDLLKGGQFGEIAFAKQTLKLTVSPNEKIIELGLNHKSLFFLQLKLAVLPSSACYTGALAKYGKIAPHDKSASKECN